MQTSLNLRKDPFVLFLGATLILLFALALRPMADLDLPGKVMFGFPLHNMVWFIPFFLLSYWLIYIAMKKFLYSITITWVHVLTTVIPIFLIVILVYVGISPLTDIRDNHELIGDALQLMTLIFLFGQLLFIANVALGITKRLTLK